MPPKGKSKAQALKHSYLGQFTKHARNKEEMKSKITLQEKEMQDLEKIMNEQSLVIEQAKKDMERQQVEIDKSRRKLCHKNTNYQLIASRIKNVDLNLKRLKPAAQLMNNAFSITKKVKALRKKNPTKMGLSHATMSVRRSQTFQACSVIHGATADNVEPLAHGLTHKLLAFKSFPKKNPNSTLFVIGLGGDGAPGVGTAILISFLNVANRIASSSENFLLFGANVGETATVVKCYIQELMADFRYLESQIFEVVLDGISFPVEFKLGELPNDMKMLCFLAGELSNASRYFSTFANVSSKTSKDPTKSISNSVGDWNPFSYEKRLENAKKALKKKAELSRTNTKKETQRSNLTSYIGQVLHSRQETVPLVGNYIGRAKAEPLHLKNNVVKELFLKMLQICTINSNMKNAKAFKDINDKELIEKFLSFIRFNMGCNYLSKKIRQCYDESGGNLNAEIFKFQ